MKNLVKALGAIIVLIGVLFLAVYFFAVQTNLLLALGGFSMVVGIITHIIVNKNVND